MILAQALAAARAQRTQRVLPDGRAIWVSRVFPASGATPERWGEVPRASLCSRAVAYAWSFPYDDWRGNLIVRYG